MLSLPSPRGDLNRIIIAQNQRIQNLEVALADALSVFSRADNQLRVRVTEERIETWLAVLRQR